MFYPSLLPRHALLSILLIAACDDAASEHKAAVGAQNEANGKIAVATTEANQKVAGAQAEAKDKINTATQEADQKIKEAQLTADAKIAAAKENFLKLREEFRHATQSNLIALEHSVAELEHKAKKAVGKERADLHAKIKQIHARHEAFASNYKLIENESATTWDETKARLDKEWAELKALLDSK